MVSCPHAYQCGPVSLHSFARTLQMSQEGSVGHTKLKLYRLANGHCGMMLMHSPIVRDLKASLLPITAAHKAQVGKERGCGEGRPHFPHTIQPSTPVFFFSPLPHMSAQMSWTHWAVVPCCTCLLYCVLRQHLHEAGALQTFQGHSRLPLTNHCCFPSLPAAEQARGWAL